MEIFKVKSIIDQIAATSSKNGKEDILRQNKDNELLKKILYFVFNDFITTGISKKKILKKINMTDHTGTEINTIEQAMDYLSENNTGRDVDIFRIQNFICTYENVELKGFLIKIVTKDLSIGISAATINKIYGKDFIPVFDVMLAKKYEDHKHKIKRDFVLTQKLDGQRIVIIKEDDIVKSFTRTGKPYEGLEEIEEDIRKIDNERIVFDGELIADTEGSTHEIYTETTSKARSKGSNKTGLLFHIFDVLPLNDFKNGKSTFNAVDRKKFLSFIFKTENLPHCREVKPLYIGSDKSKIDEWLEYAHEQGWEGLMINLDKPYECKRTDSILKIKTMNTCDLKIIGFEEGTGKYKDNLGALIVDYKGNKVGVGSGFSDADREYIWNSRDELLSRIVEVQYFEESKNSEGTLSLRFPVFKRIRETGKEVSYN